MNSEELEKYLKNVILPLFPDLVDVPGVPNATGKTQETDQNYGPFKTGFRGNVCKLTQARYDQNLNLQVVDIPLLVFGGVCSKTDCVLSNSFQNAFSRTANLNVWRKCGALPLTRDPVFSAEVRTEVAVGVAANRNGMSFHDDMADRLLEIETLNYMFCDILSAQGFDGAELKLDAPKRETYVAVTKPMTKERVKAIAKARTHGQLFYATGGSYLNSDDFFRAQAL